MILLFTIACLTEESTLTSWNGYMYQQTLEEEDGMAIFDAGNISLLDIDGTVLMEASNPIEGTPFYWQFDLEESQLDAEISMRIKGANTIPMVWRGSTPSTDASWLSGALFTQESDFTQSYFNSFATDIDTIDLADTAVAHLWGQPLVPEEWIDCTIQVFDGSGEEIEVHSFSQLSNGTITTDTSTGIIWFFAWNIPPGEVTLQITPATGPQVTTMYPAQGGDILSAMFYALGEVEE